MKKLSIIILTCWLCVATKSLADAESPSAAPPAAPATSSAAKPTTYASFEEAYKSGIEFYKKNDYANAQLAFGIALEKDANNASALTNLAIVEFKQAKKGLAIAHFRKALNIDPELDTAKSGLKFALSQLDIKEIPHQIEAYESLRADFLQPVKLSIYLFLTGLTLFSGGWTLLNYLGKRKRALAAEEAPPTLPLISILFLLTFVGLATLTGFKYYDEGRLRGTIVDEKVSVQAAPGDNQVQLFELYAGFEVTIDSSKDDWIQVTYPGASTGWIKKSALLLTSGKEI